MLVVAAAAAALVVAPTCFTPTLNPHRCCGDSNNGLWVNGGSVSGNYYAGTVWVR